MSRVLPLLLVAVVAAGCGGARQAAAPTTGPAAEGDEGVALTRYLARLEPQELRLERLRKGVLKAVDDLNVRRPDASWSRAAARLRKVTHGLDQVSLSIAHTKAPEALGAAHQDLAESVSVLEDYVYGLQQALDSRIPMLLSTAAGADVTRMAELRGSWESSVKEYARRLGVTLPAWLGGPSLAA